MALLQKQASSRIMVPLLQAMEFSVVAALSPNNMCSLPHIVLPWGKYELSCEKEHPALLSKVAYLRVHNIHYVHLV